ncbi:hypothetical protein C2G38_2272568 [Gigaspora rosea]|uniref:SWIM-type domain-containing protein n=1 Tax=Gigaspora rosea TaxID=44941 RepID=A0A397UKP7_9GLOM|nr:hypothetical protein C2G38_2272568 [Gigaspora rosea]
MHFGAITTQRVEGAQSSTKHAIKSSGSLMKAFNSLDIWLRLHHEETFLQYENESIGIDPLLAQNDNDRLRPLLERLSQFALNKIKCELLNATTYEACLCELLVNYNLPCRHLLPIKDEQQKSFLLDKLDDILAIPEVKLSDIKVPERIIEKGCPSGTKRLPNALEHMEKEEKKKLIMGQTKLKAQLLFKKKSLRMSKQNLLNAQVFHKAS